MLDDRRVEHLLAVELPVVVVLAVKGLPVVVLAVEVPAVEGLAVEGVSSSAPGADRGRLASTFMKNHMSLVLNYLYAYGNRIRT